MLNNVYQFLRINDYWRNIDKNILFGFHSVFLVFFFFFINTSLAGERLDKDFYHYFLRHLIFDSLLFSNVLYFILQCFIFKKINNTFFYSFILLMLVPVIGIEVKGAQRWLDMYVLRLQPIEIIKPFLF